MAARYCTNKPRGFEFSEGAVSGQQCGNQASICLSIKVAISRTVRSHGYIIVFSVFDVDFDVERQVAVVDLEHQQVEAGQVVAAAGFAPLGFGG